MAIVLIVGSMLLCMAGFELFDGCWLFLPGAVICIVGLSVISLVMIRHRWRMAMLGLSAAAVGAFWIVMAFAPGGDRIIGRTKAPDGTEMCMVQKFSGHWAEPYRVSFYYRRPGQDWGWFYYEHEDTRWWFGTIRLSADGKQAEIRRCVSPVAYFHLPNEAFTIVRWNRTIEGAQHRMPPGWEPEDELGRR